jgi:uncharacterized DUF497 family protein
MGGNSRCSWHDGKRERNLANHGYDFADIEEVFDGRFCITRLDTRKNYGELRYNMLVDFKGRVLNITYNPRAGLAHLISVRPASREERNVYYAKNPSP